jgi:hypothetical protein
MSEAALKRQQSIQHLTHAMRFNNIRTSSWSKNEPEKKRHAGKPAAQNRVWIV